MGERLESRSESGGIMGREKKENNYSWEERSWKMATSNSETSCRVHVRTKAMSDLEIQVQMNSSLVLYMWNEYLESLNVYHSPESGLQQYAV